VERPLTLTGAWNIANAEELHAIFAGYLEPGEDFALNLSGVERCDTAALQLILSLRKTAAERGLNLRLTAISPAIRETANALAVAFTDRAERGGDGV
jgi:anti-anti-sigma regulatory factor